MSEEVFAFPNLLSEFVYTRTYSRWLEEEKRRETWPETVRRYVNFIFTGKQVPAELPEQAYRAILKMDVMPSMRSLWCAGPAMERDNTCGYNCSFLPVDNLKAFSEALYILMQGTGVGFSVERTFVDHLPKVEKRTGKSVPYTIADSTEGWADAVYFGITAFHRGDDVEFSYDRIRPKGARLKTKGGRASGPEPLKRVLDFARQTIFNAEGRSLLPIEAHDIMCMIAEIVMVGGFRRASLISFSDPDDDAMRHAKDFSLGEFPAIRYMSNNSAVFESRPSREVFNREWNALVRSGSGERGVYITGPEKREKRGGDFRSNPCVTGDTRVMTDGGIFPIRELVGKASGLSIDGRFGTGGFGRTTEEGAFATGEKEIFRLKTLEGFELRLTADHRVMTPRGWVEARALKTGDRVHVAGGAAPAFGRKGCRESGLLAGWITGDGTLLKDQGNTPRLYFYGEDRVLLETMRSASQKLTGVLPSISSFESNERVHFQSAELREFLGSLTQEKHRIPDFVWQGTEECQKAYLSALFSADGHVEGCRDKGVRVCLSQSKLDLLRDVQLLLLNFGIVGRIWPETREAGWRDLPDGNGGEKSYFCEADHVLTIAKQNFVQFAEKIGFVHPLKQQKMLSHLGDSERTRGFYRESFMARVESVESCGKEVVYDLTEPSTHSFVANGLVVHNCGEILLRYKRATDPWTGEGGGGQFCNLTACVMRAEDTLETMTEKVRIATWLGAVQSSYSHFPYLRPAWEELCAEDRLLGVDITGQCDNPRLSGDEEAMTYLNAVARSTAIIAADSLGISRPAAVTCGKPSGNSSQFVDCASGFHPRYAKYYYRHVRISAKDPLFRLIRDFGVPVFKENGQDHLEDHQVDVWVARFPVKAPEGAMTRHDEKALEQLDRYLKIMNSWVGEKGHNQSATIYVREDEWEAVGNWLWEHFDRVTGLSFLPYDGGLYKLAPYVELTEEQYHEAMTGMPKVHFGDLSFYEQMDEGHGAQEAACVGGSCEI